MGGHQLPDDDERERLDRASAQKHQPQTNSADLAPTTGSAGQLGIERRRNGRCAAGAHRGPAIQDNRASRRLACRR